MIEYWIYDKAGETLLASTLDPDYAAELQEKGYQITAVCAETGEKDNDNTL